MLPLSVAFRIHWITWQFFSSGIQHILAQLTASLKKKTTKEGYFWNNLKYTSFLYIPPSLVLRHDKLVCCLLYYWWSNNISAIREYPKNKTKKNYKYNIILAARNLQNIGVSFHQVPLASDTWNEYNKLKMISSIKAKNINIWITITPVDVQQYLSRLRPKHLLE